MKTKQLTGPYSLLGYSFGAAVAVEISLQLQAGGDNCYLILLDGSHAYVKMFTDKYATECASEEEKQVSALCNFSERLLDSQQQVDN